MRASRRCALLRGSRDPLRLARRLELGDVGDDPHPHPALGARWGERLLGHDPELLPAIGSVGVGICRDLHVPSGFDEGGVGCYRGVLIVCEAGFAHEKDR